MGRTLLVVDYLRSGGTFESLLAEHAVHAKPYNGKISFIYDQLAARDDNKLAQQCRGLVLREGTLDVVAYPFDRFFNHGQGAAAQIDWATARFEEKLDGTLLIVYWDDRRGEWMCATRSMCEAHGDINGAGTFAQLASAAARTEGASDLNDLMNGSMADRGVTYMFELTSPYNRIVCQYDDLGLTLLGARRLSDFQELDPVAVAGELGFNVAKTWGFSSIDELLEVAKDWAPSEYEGVIVKDANFNRIKVKTPQYLAAAHASEGICSSWRAVAEAILTGHADDLMAIVPKLGRDRLEALRAPIAELITQTERDYAEIAGIDDMKAYAERAKGCAWPSALFALKRGKTESIAKFAEGTRGDSMLDMLRARGWSEPDLIPRLGGEP